MYKSTLRNEEDSNVHTYGCIASTIKFSFLFPYTSSAIHYPKKISDACDVFQIHILRFIKYKKKHKTQSF